MRIHGLARARQFVFERLRSVGKDQIRASRRTSVHAYADRVEAGLVSAILRLPRCCSIAVTFDATKTQGLLPTN
jgi:hypothetical protein